MISEGEGSSSVSLTYYDLLQVFQYLSLKSLVNAAKVCVAWREAAYSPQFWTGCLPKLSYLTLDAITAAGLKQRKIQAIRLKSDTFEDGSQKFSQFFEALPIKTLIIQMNSENIAASIPTKSLAYLRCLALTGKAATALEDLEKVLSPLVSLQQLHIEVDEDSVSQTDENSEVNESTGSDGEENSSCLILKTLLSNLPELKDLELTLTGGEGSSSFSGITAPNIHRLVLAGNSLTIHTFTEIDRCFPQLKHLTMTESANDEEDAEEYDFPKDSKHFQMLESVYLGREECTIMLPDNFLMLFRNSRNITAVNLTIQTPYYGAELEDEDFENIITTLPSLKALIYGHCVSLEMLTTLAPKMASLEVLASLGTLFMYRKDPEVAAKFISIINEHMPRLYSLLEIDLDLREYGDLDNVKYLTISGSRWHEGICRKLSALDTPSDGDHCVSSTSWTEVEGGSVEWHEAVGTKHFQLEDTYYLGLMNKH